MDASGFGAFQHQIKKNQEDVQSYLKDLDSWKDSISKTDDALRSGKKANANSSGDGVDNNLPPVRNSLHRKKKVKRKKLKDEQQPQAKPAKISGFDFRAWDKFDVDKALEDVDKTVESSSYDEETDEEWEDERRKQQALYEKDQGNDYFKKQKYNEAIECYTRGINCDPSNAILYANRAMALLKQEKFGAAENDCTDAIALDPTYVKAYIRRGTARQKLKKLQGALDDYSQVMKIDPDNKVAQRSVIQLEQELKIAEEGIVIPVHKPVKYRSKKPLRRIEIEEIDSTDIKRKISDMSATTRAQQSAEKKKIEARDSDMFSKFTDRLRDDSANDSKQTTPVPTIQSPADIGQPPPSAKRSSHSEGINNQTKKNTPETSTSPVAPASPRAPVSPRAPANSFQFQRDWKEVKSDLDSTYNYLKCISPSSYPKLFGESLETKLLIEFISVFNKRFLSDSIDVTEHLLCLAKVKRFSMIIMLMSDKEKSVIKEVVKKVSLLEGCDKEKLKEIERLYEL